MSVKSLQWTSPCHQGHIALRAHCSSLTKNKETIHFPNNIRMEVRIHRCKVMGLIPLNILILWWQSCAMLHDGCTRMEGWGWNEGSAITKSFYPMTICDLWAELSPVSHRSSQTIPVQRKHIIIVLLNSIDLGHISCHWKCFLCLHLWIELVHSIIFTLTHCINSSSSESVYFLLVTSLLYNKIALHPQLTNKQFDVRKKLSLPHLIAWCCDSVMTHGGNPLVSSII